MFKKLIRIGRDTTLRQTPNGNSVASIAGVYDVGWGDKKKGQWIDVTLWGKQAEALTQYLTKGKQVVIYADDLCIETYPKNDGTEGFKLTCKAINIDLVGSKSDNEAPQQQAQQQQQPQQNNQQQAPQQPQENTQQSPPQSSGFNDDYSDDIPF
jgi:single-strand DNA-binding protein